MTAPADRLIRKHSRVDRLVGPATHPKGKTVKALAQRRRSAREDGFTLIELLIVIIILGILAAIVVFAVGSTRKDSVTSSCKTDFKSVALSAEAVNTKNGSYPAAQTDTVSNGTNGALLKSYPSSTDYTLTYAKTATGFTITVGGANVVGGAVKDDDSGTVLNAACAGK